MALVPLEQDLSHVTLRPSLSLAFPTLWQFIKRGNINELKAFLIFKTNFAHFLSIFPNLFLFFFFICPLTDSNPSQIVHFTWFMTSDLLSLVIRLQQVQQKQQVCPPVSS